MTQIRILHIVGIMNMGGLENLIMNIYRNIDRDKIQFDFLVTREEKGIFDNEILELGGHIYNIPHMSKVGYIKYKKIVYDFFKNHPQYKVIHCHRDALNSLYLKQAKKANIPLRIAHSHNIKLVESKNIRGIAKILLKKYTMLFTNKYSTERLACSNDAWEWLFGKSSNDNSINIINNGIDVKKYNYKNEINLKIRKDLGVDENTFLIGHVGRFDIQKNHKFLIDIMKKLDKENFNYKFCFVGDGILLDEVKRNLKDIGLENKVIFTGIQNNVNEIMMAFDVFAFPSLFEGLGIVLVEAQATGLRCLVSDKVPKECDMGLNLIRFLPINDSDIWVKNLKVIESEKEISRMYRKTQNQKIIENGYDILNTVDKVQKIYTQGRSIR